MTVLMSLCFGHYYSFGRHCFNCLTGGDLQYHVQLQQIGLDRNSQDGGGEKDNQKHYPLTYLWYYCLKT